MKQIQLNWQLAYYIPFILFIQSPFIWKHSGCSWEWLHHPPYVFQWWQHHNNKKIHLSHLFFFKECVSWFDLIVSFCDLFFFMFFLFYLLYFFQSHSGVISFFWFLLGLIKNTQISFFPSFFFLADWLTLVLLWCFLLIFLCFFFFCSSHLFHVMR